MSTALRQRMHRLRQGMNTPLGRWIGMMGAFVVLAAVFHPLFLLLGGVIGAVTFGLAAWGGWVLGPRAGALYGVLTSLLSIPLWTMEYGFSITENISAPIMCALIGFTGGWLHGVVKRVRSQAAALEAANAALKSKQLELLQIERLALFGEIAAGVAHEVNQPLTVIALASELAQRQLTTGNYAAVAERLVQVREQIDRAAQIIARLKTSGRYADSAEPSLHSLNEIAAAAIKQVRPQFTALGIALRVELQPALAPLMCRAEPMRQVLVYLLLNARDAVDGTPEKQVLLATAHDANHLVITVQDTGAGINESTIRHIFDPFFTTKDVGQGSGLGLSISHRIVYQHGGRIDVASRPGEGARFTVRLPLSGSVAGSIHTAPAQPAPESALPPARSSRAC